MIGYRHHNVARLSVCNPVYCGAQSGCTGLKVVHRGHTRQLPIHFFRHFCCRMYRLATKHTDNTNQPQCGEWTPPACDVYKVDVTSVLATASSRRFGSATIPYVVRSTIGLPSDSYTLLSLLVRQHPLTYQWWQCLSFPSRHLRGWNSSQLSSEFQTLFLHR